MKINGRTVTNVLVHYEHIIIMVENINGGDEDNYFFIDNKELVKVLQLADYEVAKKRTRYWGIPIFKNKK